MLQKKSKKTVTVIAKILFTTLPLYVIFSRIDIHNLLKTLTSVAWWTIPAFLCTMLLTMILQGVRWWLLMRPFAPSISFRKTLSCHFAAQFYSVFLPTSAAQDFIRAALLSKYTDGFLPWAATFISRLSGLSLLFLFCLTGVLMIGRSAIPQDIIKIILAVFAIFSILCFLSFSKRLTKPIRLFLEKKIPVRFTSKISEIREVIYCYRNEKTVLISNIFVTAVVQFLTIVCSLILTMGITDKLFFKETLAFLPIIEIITISIPLTPGGIGIRDGLVAIFFKYLQLSNEQLGAYIIVSYLAMILKLIGFFPIFLGAIPRREKTKISEEVKV
jgi:glycosyltransferase 2 family protein